MTDEAPKPSRKQRLATLFAEHGRVAIVCYLVLSALVVAGFSIAIGLGFQPSTATGVLEVIGAGWLAAKVTVPLRILVVLVITPPIAAFLARRRAKKTAEV